MTIKPIDLNKWLATLLLPPDSVQQRRLLVPFMGTGSECIGAMLAGWDEITGVEMSKEYHAIAEKRLSYWDKKKDLPQTDDKPKETALLTKYKGFGF